ncbi:MAG: sensor histidine kinase, partial [Sphingobacteriales bacterium]
NFSNQQKTEFLSIASHELNSPLTVLRSYAQIALKIADDKDQKLKPYLVKIDQQTGKLIKLVRQLLDISKFEHGEFNYNYQPVNINAYLSSVIDNIRLIVDKHDIRLNVVEDAQVMIDEMRIEQVLSNLVSNAAKYSDVGTIITITTKIIDGQLVIAIADQGIGMSEESTIKVFEKFYRDNQIKMKYSGLGMGLYISSKIVQDHNGKITVISELDKGSVFSFGLPIVIS